MMNSVLTREEEKNQKPSVVDEYAIGPAYDGPSWLPPVPPVSEELQDDGPKRRRLIHTLLSMLAGIVNVFAGKQELRCHRCRSEMAVLNGAYQESGCGWWALSYQYRCLACDYVWDESPLLAEDPSTWL